MNRSEVIPVTLTVEAHTVDSRFEISNYSTESFVTQIHKSIEELDALDGCHYFRLPYVDQAVVIPISRFEKTRELLSQCIDVLERAGSDDYVQPLLDACWKASEVMEGADCTELDTCAQVLLLEDLIPYHQYWLQKSCLSTLVLAYRLKRISSPCLSDYEQVDRMCRWDWSPQ